MNMFIYLIDLVIGSKLDQMYLADLFSPLAESARMMYSWICSTFLFWVIVQFEQMSLQIFSIEFIKKFDTTY